MTMPICTSCGSQIPEGQGKSCSMCYGDISHGSDGYYAEWARQQQEKAEQEQQEREQAEQEYYDNQGEDDNDKRI